MFRERKNTFIIPLTRGINIISGKMFNLEKFIADFVINRPVSMFAQDIEANKDKLSAEIKGN